MYSLTDEQQMLVEAVTEMAENEFADRAFEQEEFPPRENVELLADRGYLGINFDTEYGGGGMSEFESMLMIEIIGRVCPDTSEYLVKQQMVAPRAISMFGTEAAKETYLPGVVEGKRFVGIAMSEPGAGSDTKAMQTTVEERDGGTLVLDGEKTWVSDVPESDALVVWAKFPDGLGSLILDLDSPGVEVGQEFTNMAGHTQSHIFIEEVEVPEKNVLTRGTEGFKEQLKALNWERLAMAAQSNAMAQNGLDKAFEYAQDRVQFDQPIAEFQGIEWKFAEKATRLEASRSLCHRAALTAVERDRIPDPLEATMAKLYAAEICDEVIHEALQIHGANGYQKGHPLEYLYRFSRAYHIAGGTDEIMKNTIASLLKKQGTASMGISGSV